MQPYSCAYFSFDGEATRKAKLVAPIVTTADDGTRTTYDDDSPYTSFPAQVIYAGLPIPEPDNTRQSGGAPANEFAVALGVAVLAGLVVVLGLHYLQRRRAAG